MPERRQFSIVESEHGWLGIMRSAAGICRTTLPLATSLDVEIELYPCGDDVAIAAECFGMLTPEILARLRGGSLGFAPRLDLSAGSPFQQRVWQAVMQIRRGETRSYGWLAGVIGLPRAGHAVGQAVARNPLPLLVPCHRVVAADGSLGGYGRGHAALATKRTLLRREGVYYEGPLLEQIRGHGSN